MVTENFEKMPSNDDFGNVDMGDYSYDGLTDDKYNLAGEDLKEEKRKLKCKIKSDAVVVGATIITNGLPMLIDIISRKRQGLPSTSVSKERMLKFGVTSAVPILMLVDDLFLKGKIQKKVPLSDIRNVVNVVSAYPNTHKVVNSIIDNNLRKSNGKATIVSDKSSNLELTLDVANLVMPYVATKMTDDSMNFVEKLKSAVPVPMIGYLVKRVCNLSPGLRQAYDGGTTLLRVAGGATRAVGSAMRSNPNSSVSKATNTLTDILDTVSDLTGVNRNSGFGGNGRYGGYNGGYGGNHGGWGNF